MCRSLCLVTAITVLGSCDQTAPRVTAAADSHGVAAQVDARALAQALNIGDETRINALTNDILAGKRLITRMEVSNDSKVAPNVLLRASYANRDYQLGVNTVSEYVLCLLEIKNQTSSEQILRKVDPAMQENCSRGRPCEVCNSQAFPVDVDVKRRIVGYWLPKLK